MAQGIVQRFPRVYRLTQTDDYSSVFGFKRAIRGRYFLLHYGPCHPAGKTARLGLVIGKKSLKLAVWRNRVKRIIREQFRLMHRDLPACDLVFRLASRLTRPNRREVAEEVRHLLGRLPNKPLRKTETLKERHREGKIGEPFS
jgi:ribonuclease P protein component